MSFLNGKGFLEYYTITSQTPDMTDYVDLANGKEVGGLGPRWFGFLWSPKIQGIGILRGYPDSNPKSPSPTPPIYNKMIEPHTVGVGHIW